MNQAAISYAWQQSAAYQHPCREGHHFQPIGLYAKRHFFYCSACLLIQGTDLGGIELKRRSKRMVGGGR